MAARFVRDQSAPVLLAGIAAAVSPRVVPLWNQHLFGGASPQNLSSSFGGDFVASATTAHTTDILVDALKADLESNPPTFPPGSSVTTVDIPARIGPAIAEIGNPASSNVMDFGVIGEIPGNIAGGIGRTQVSCPAGARPSPFDDDRTAAGTASVARNPDGSLTVTPLLVFTVRDTIDLCPGNCGASREQIATVPMSRFEATGISGDVPFTVDFPAPPRVVVAHPPAPAPTPPSSAPGPMTGEVTASRLRIRLGPNTAAPIVGHYPRGAVITIQCETSGTVVDGDPIWVRTNDGFVSSR